MHVRASRALRSILSRIAYSKYSENPPLVMSGLPAFGDRFRALGASSPGLPGKLSGSNPRRLSGRLSGMLLGKLSGKLSGRLT